MPQGIISASTEMGRDLLLFCSLLTPSAAWLAVAPPFVTPARALRAGWIALEEDSWSFGDADDNVGMATADAMDGEERELSDKEKEIARLRAAEKFMMRDTGDGQCQICSYTYKWEEGASPQVPKKTPFELVPESFTCPTCKSPKAFFDPVQVEVAGFADNQNYGFGTNAMTESQKSGLIFGGLGFFFFLLIGGYALN